MPLRVGGFVLQAKKGPLFNVKIFEGFYPPPSPPLQL